MEATQEPAISQTYLTEDGIRFVTERHLATLSTLSGNGSIHAVPVGFTLHDGTAFVITTRTSQKVLNARRSGHATLCQVEGAGWITLIGQAEVLDDPESIAVAVTRYAARYRQPRVNPERVAIAVRVERILGSAGFVARE
ncbi:PPOX class F420-dependent oxidoreductase [Frigoribacterium sp. CG_9.8]|uniref:PPOX class F420-dependent oxidoreductase n=1 Tax=Frigoribacterium sp. CG_9.8 TaxID=2787733 RepID=UPI0018C9A8D0|nr:PPOX class F420-dependent oxidoreductase [Frigoribacterium sp. CG_9.8]MBG6106862.1 PPOX class probable F420-dependent enzyme [Frigoribacterium sp. CG_9.8]